MDLIHVMDIGHRTAEMKGYRGSRTHAINETTPPASLIFRLQKWWSAPGNKRTLHVYILCDCRHKAGFYDEWHLGQSKGATVIDERRNSILHSTHCPLPKTLPYPCRRVSMTGTTSEFSVSPFFSSAGTKLHNLSTLIIGRQNWLRVRW